MKNATRLAVCSIVTALSVVLMFFGGITFVLAYAVPMLVGLLMIMLKTTFSTSCAWITYIATALLSFILVADKECMLMYVMFFGFYPILYPSLQKIKIPVFRAFVKLLLFNIAISIVQILLVYIFHIPFLESGEGKWFIAIFALLMNVLFIIYDKLLMAVYRLYVAKIEKRVKRLMK